MADSFLCMIQLDFQGRVEYPDPLIFFNFFFFFLARERSRGRITATDSPVYYSSLAACHGRNTAKEGIV